ncbi:hypothetical protein H9660_15680 [Clostridium sp. Sa3CUN1]|uniref:Uncharacterized protein n=1 Tax=Clostridium gallinarum TaxID=2762246 RepID=A0ABR8Q822_9CLOT|nr:hypothetical protein [Clostridium gallinarum]MBD7916572.1 hypothetical protein [Clostridium gallinarum]
MIRTFVCEKDGCSGNIFYLEGNEENLNLICSQCKSRYNINVTNKDYIIIPNCSNCSSETFKVYRDIERDDIYLKCSQCGSVPEKLYIDSDGVQVSYEAKLLNDIKQIMNLVEQRIYNLEVNVKDLEGGQNILEQSLAYINRYLVEKN